MVIGYIIGACVIVGGTVLLVYYGNGYAYDIKTGRLIHRGLVLLESYPSGAQVSFNGKQLKQKTPVRHHAEGGVHRFDVTKDGYRDWHKQISVTPAWVSLAQYVILLPDTIPVQNVASYPQISQFLASRDRRRIAFNVPSGRDAGIWVMDSRSRDRRKVYTPAVATPAQPAESVQIVSWSNDASHILLQRTVADVPNQLVVDAEGGGQPTNLTDTYSANFTDLVFSPGNWREMYWNSPEGLRRLDTGARTITGPLTPRTAAFTFAGDRILYVDTSQPTAALYSLERSGRKQRIVPALPVSSRYEVAYATYISAPQAVVLAPDDGTATIYSDIFETVSSKTIPAAAEHASFNGDGRFVLLWDAKAVSTYDLEFNRVYAFPAGQGAIASPSWFDNYHVVFNRGGQAVMSEYDANYANGLSKGDLPAFNSPDDKFVYTVAAAADGSSQIRAARIRQ